MDTTIKLINQFLQSKISVFNSSLLDIPLTNLHLTDHALFATSGTAGDAKVVAISRDAMIHSATMVNQHLQISENSTWGLALPLNHVGGFSVVVRAFQAKCRFSFFPEKWQPQQFCNWVKIQQISHTSLVPTQVFDLVKARQYAPKNLQVIVVGGGKLTQQVGEAARKLGWNVLASYGSTEAASQIATQPISMLTLPYQEDQLQLLPHWHTRINEDGILEIEGRSLFSGTLQKQFSSWVYVERSNNWHNTNDKVNISGNQLAVIGRATNEIKILGELVNLDLLDSFMMEISDQQLANNSFSLIATPHLRMENAIVAVFDEVVDNDLIIELISKFNSLVPGYCRIAGFSIVSDLNISNLGKINKRKIAHSLTNANITQI